MVNIGAAKWTKSTRSGSQGQCVEVARNLGSVVAVRDSKDPHGPILTVDRPAWAGFLAGLAGEAPGAAR